ncbi:MAG: competence/damage-inducible protein A [Candidatus Kapabacteria bacterium]|nr:competence/damage-inducible protein A [Candidatus Kapabacteria bacterium]
MLNISILTIGDEICIGQITNTNVVHISAELTRIGANVLTHSTIGDEKNIMLSEIDRLLKSSDVLILTGGLGPTHDDITKPVLCEYFDDQLIYREQTLENLRKRYSKLNIEMTDRNMRQAQVPSKCISLENSAGAAPGIMFEKDGSYLFSVPGVPGEMRAIMKDHIVPFVKNMIAERNENLVLYKQIMTYGIFESSLADMIGDIDKLFDKGDSLAFLHSFRGVRLRIGVHGESRRDAETKLAVLEQKIQDKVGEYIYGSGEDSIPSAIGKLLTERKQTLAVAESCTAGMLGKEITSVSGSSAYFSGGVLVYSNEIKEKILDVKHDTLVKYGAVSEQTACELAANVRSKFNADYSLSITGVAGPGGGTEDKPVGTVWIGYSDKNETFAKKYFFGGNREINRERSVANALALLYKKLRGK